MKNSKRVLSLILVCIFVVSLFAGCGTKSTTADSSAVSTDAKTTDAPAATTDATKQPADYKGEISVWTWDKAYFDASIADFNATYPNVKVNLTAMGWGDYITKFETAKASGGSLPDVALGESYWWGKFLSLKDTFLDLSTLGFKQEDIVDAASKVVVNTEGKFVAIPQGLGIGTIWYRKDLAKQVFGTDVAADIAAKYTSFDDFILNAGKEVKEKSAGKLTAFTNAADVMEALFSAYKANGQSYIDGDTLKVKENLTPTYTTLATALKEGYIAKVNGPAFDASWASGKVVFFASAGWREGNIPSSDKEGKGRWGVMVPPGGAYFRGGTGEFIVDNKDKAKAELAALFMKHRLYSDAGMKVNNKFGNLTAIKSIQDKKLTNGVNDFYGIDVTAFLFDAVFKMKAASYGKHDSIIENELKTAAMDMEKSPFTADQAVEKVITASKSKDDSIK